MRDTLQTRGGAPTVVLNRVRSLVRQLGAVDAIAFLAARAIARASGGRVALQKYYFVAQPVHPAPQLPPNRGRSFVVEQAAPDHPLREAFPRPPHVIEQRYRHGARCFVVSKGGSYAGYLWLQEGSYPEDEVRCLFTPLPRGAAVWDFDVHVAESHRASFAFARLWDEANAWLHARGVRRTISRISAFNPGSLASHARLGARPFASAVFVTGRRCQLMLAGRPPFVHWSSGPDRTPELRLDAERRSDASRG